MKNKKYLHVASRFLRLKVQPKNLEYKKITVEKKSSKIPPEKNLQYECEKYQKISLLHGETWKE